MSAKVWAVGLLITGLIIVIVSLTHVLRSKKEGDAFDNQLGGSLLAMAFGGLLAASGLIIGIIQIIKHLWHLIH